MFSKIKKFLNGIMNNCFREYYFYSDKNGIMPEDWKMIEKDWDKVFEDIDAVFAKFQKINRRENVKSRD